MAETEVFSADDVRHACKEMKVQSVQLQFTDILGIVKHLDLPTSQLEKALGGEVMFDGSAIEGFVRMQESDMYLRPDPTTFCPLPWKSDHGTTARMICDVVGTDGGPFPGDPRQALRRVTQEAASHGFTLMAGAEPEFFLFRRIDQKPTTETGDLAGYFDMAPSDMGEKVREQIVLVLEQMGFSVESSHHESAPGQHEIDFKHAEALAAADGLVTFRVTARAVAALGGMHATFMPKPVSDVNGSGLHLHQSLFRGSDNAFFDARTPDQLSTVARHYLGGLIEHARALTALTNPLVNSYKRLVPGYEAPTEITWSLREHSPLIRIPARRGHGTRLELRSPDPACNPYLALAALLQCGLDGIRRKLEPPPQSGGLPPRGPEREHPGVQHLPANLEEALECLEEDVVVRTALGEHIFRHFVSAKRIEWDYYRRQVHQWELDQYLSTF